MANGYAGNIVGQFTILLSHQTPALCHSVTHIVPADGTSTVATATTIGHIAVWGLDERRLVAVVRDAHDGSVGGMEFIQSQPLMATSSVDNSIKVIVNIYSSCLVYI